MKMSQSQTEPQFEALYPSDLVSQVHIISKNWQINSENLRSTPSHEQLKQLNVIIDFKIVKRIVDRLFSIKKAIFKELEVIIFNCTLPSKKEQKSIDFNELHRIGTSLQIQSRRTGLILKIIHPFDQYTIQIKQIRFQKKQVPSNQQMNCFKMNTNQMEIEDLKDSSLQKSSMKDQNKRQEQFFMQLKNIKQKVTLPFELTEEIMIHFTTLENMFNQLFIINEFLMKQSQKLHPIVAIDSLNIGEIDLSKDIAASFIVFLNQFLILLDTTKIKSLSFKAKSSEKHQSLLKEYLFTFAKFLSRCNELCQIQIILDFNNTQVDTFSKMFSYLILNSLSSNICQRLQLVDLSFSNVGKNSKQLLSQLSIATFVKNRVDKLKNINIRIYSAETSLKFNEKKPKSSIIPSIYLNFYISGQKLGVEEFENAKLIRHLKFDFKGVKELRQFMKSKIDFNEILLFENSKNTIETLSTLLGQEQQLNQEGNNIMSIDIHQIIQDKFVDEQWIVLINELFLNCKQSVQSVTCYIQFDENLQTTTQPMNQLEIIRSESLSMMKTQQRKPFEQMIINLLQPINYKQLKNVQILNTMYNVTFNQLLLKSICASKLSFFEIAETLKIDQLNSTFMINLTNQTINFISIVPQLSFQSIQCTVNTLNEEMYKQIDNILQKSKPAQIVKQFEIIINNKLEPTLLSNILNLLQKINHIKIKTKQFNVEILFNKIIYKQSQIEYPILRAFNYLKKEYLHLYIDYQQIDFNEAESFCNFKFVNIYIDNSKVKYVSRIWPTKLIANTKNVHKLVLYGIKNRSSQTLKNISTLIKLINPSKIVDLFLSKKCKGFFELNSKSKFIKIAQQLKKVNEKLKFRQEIIFNIMLDYLL